MTWTSFLRSEDLAFCSRKVVGQEARDSAPPQTRGNDEARSRRLRESSGNQLGSRSPQVSSEPEQLHGNRWEKPVHLCCRSLPASQAPSPTAHNGGEKPDLQALSLGRERESRTHVEHSGFSGSCLRGWFLSQLTGLLVRNQHTWATENQEKGLAAQGSTTAPPAADGSQHSLFPSQHSSPWAECV